MYGVARLQFLLTKWEKKNWSPMVATICSLIENLLHFLYWSDRWIRLDTLYGAQCGKVLYDRILKRCQLLSVYNTEFTKSSVGLAVTDCGLFTACYVDPSSCVPPSLPSIVWCARESNRLQVQKSLSAAAGPDSSFV